MLSPPTISPDPAQGSSEPFTASFHYTKAPLGTPITFQVAGANPQFKLVHSDKDGKATFSYAGTYTGVDTITASSTLGTTNLTSNQAVTTWLAGIHTSFLTLNLSPTSIAVGKPVTLIASLADVSVMPPAAVQGATIQISLEGNSCSGTTDSKGNASGSVTPGIAGLTTQTATFGGDSKLLPAQATQAFNVTAPPTAVPTSTPTPTATPHCHPDVDSDSHAYSDGHTDDDLNGNSDEDTGRDTDGDDQSNDESYGYPDSRCASHRFQGSRRKDRRKAGSTDNRFV